MYYSKQEVLSDEHGNRYSTSGVDKNFFAVKVGTFAMLKHLGKRCPQFNGNGAGEQCHCLSQKFIEDLPTWRDETLPKMPFCRYCVQKMVSEKYFHGKEILKALGTNDFPQLTD